MSDFSIVIPSRNIENVKACVAAIRAAGETAQVVVVWDGFGGTVKASSLEELFDVQRALDAVGSGCIVVNGAKQFCFARNVNIGIAAAGTDVVICNDDALLLSGLGFSNMAVQWSDYGILSARVRGPAHFAHAALENGESNDISRVSTMVPFVCVFIRREVLLQVGGLDERFTGTAGGHEVYGGEDDDYCLRVRRHGYLIGTYNACTVDHGKLKSTFRPDGKGRSIAGARARFEEIHGFAMGTK